MVFLQNFIRATLRPVILRLVRPVIDACPNASARHGSYKAKQLAYNNGTFNYVIPAPEHQTNTIGETDLAIPPKDLWEGYGETAEWYLESGRRHLADMFSLLEEADVHIKPGGRVLDFGCSAGRMIRWLIKNDQEWEVWGADIAAENIRWCQENLSPPLNFFCNTTVPHLPFEDGSFDFIYSRSVFSHISPELADAWFLELRRILSPEGHLYATVLDNKSIEILKNNPTFRSARLAKMLAKEGKLLSSHPAFAILGLHSTIIYDIDYLQSKLDRIFEIVSLNQACPENLSPAEQILHGFQTGILLRKGQKNSGTKHILR